MKGRLRAEEEELQCTNLEVSRVEDDRMSATCSWIWRSRRRRVGCGLLLFVCVGSFVSTPPPAELDPYGGARSARPMGADSKLERAEKLLGMRVQHAGAAWCRNQVLGRRTSCPQLLYDLCGVYADPQAHGLPAAGRAQLAQACRDKLEAAQIIGGDDAREEAEIEASLPSTVRQRMRSMEPTERMLSANLLSALSKLLVSTSASPLEPSLASTFGTTGDNWNAVSSITFGLVEGLRRLGREAQLDWVFATLRQFLDGLEFEQLPCDTLADAFLTANVLKQIGWEPAAFSGEFNPSYNAAAIRLKRCTAELVAKKSSFDTAVALLTLCWSQVPDRGGRAVGAGIAQLEAAVRKDGTWAAQAGASYDQYYATSHATLALFACKARKQSWAPSLRWLEQHMGEMERSGDYDKLAESAYFLIRMERSFEGEAAVLRTLRAALKADGGLPAEKGGRTHWHPTVLWLSIRGLLHERGQEAAALAGAA